MSTKTDNFIKTIGTLARNEYLSRKKWILPSVCIAQAALESGWNLTAKTVFGIKGAGFTATTNEYYNGNSVTIQDSFRLYPDIASSVVGYYDFLSNTPRYSKALNNSNYKDAVDKLINTTDGKPYATDPDYISKINSIIKQYDLTSWDEITVTSSKKTNEEIAQEVLAGKWGNGDERKTAITKAGYDYSIIQSIVNTLYGVTTSNKKSNETIAQEVIAGKWGNGAARKTAITKAGYDYSTVQKIVNSLLK